MKKNSKYTLTVYEVVVATSERKQIIQEQYRFKFVAILSLIGIALTLMGEYKHKDEVELKYEIK